MMKDLCIEMLNKKKSTEYFISDLSKKQKKIKTNFIILRKASGL